MKINIKSEGMRLWLWIPNSIITWRFTLSLVGLAIKGRGIDIRWLEALQEG